MAYLHPKKAAVHKSAGYTASTRAGWAQPPKKGKPKTDGRKTDNLGFSNKFPKQVAPKPLALNKKSAGQLAGLIKKKGGK